MKSAFFTISKKFSPRDMGMSMAATWSWGASILVGIGIVAGHGLIPYLIWLVGNILAIPFFGYVYKYVPYAKEWKNLVPFTLLWVFIGMMAIIMNLNFLQSTLSGRQDLEVALSLNPIYSLAFVYLIGFGLWAYIVKQRLWGSYFTDLLQYRFQFLFALALAVTGLFIGLKDFVLIAEGSWHWSIFAFIGIITGVTAGGQQWQRLEAMKEDEKLKTTLWGGFWFGLYMIPCAVVAVTFAGTLLQTVLLFAVVLMVTSSTIDSGYAGLQFVGERYNLPKWIPNAFGILTLALFPVVTSWGVVQIWSFYATVRWQVVVAMIVASLLYSIRKYFLVSYWTNKK